MKENIEAVMAGNLEFCQIINAMLGSLYPAPCCLIYRLSFETTST